MIVGHGSSNSQVILLADGGTKECQNSNYALNGNNELALSQMAGSNLHVKSAYKTCLIKEYINHNAILIDSREERKKVKIIDPHLITLRKQYEPVFLQEIREINPNLIIPLGEISFNFLTGLRGIRKFRGSIMLSHPTTGFQKPIKVLPILGYQPYLIQDPALRWVGMIDFTKVPQYLNDNPPSDSLIKIWIPKTSNELRQFLERSYTPDGLLTFDIETFCNIPTCISFCFDGYESVSIPFSDKSIDADNRALMLQLVARILVSPIKKVNQNVKFDWKVLERFGFQVSNVVGDTMLAASVLTPEFPKNLGFLTSIYTDLPYFKDEGKNIKEYDPSTSRKDRFYLYNAKDSLAVHQIIKKQEKDLIEQGSFQVYQNLCKLLPIYKRMEERGFRIDDAKRLELLGKYKSLFHIQVLKLKTFCNNAYVNPLSWKQCDKLIYEELGFKKGRYAKDTGEESLEYLMAFEEAKRSPIFGKKILETIIICRKIHKVIELLELKAYPDGRWRTEYGIGMTETGRSKAGETTDYLIYREGEKFKFENIGHSFQTFAKHGFKIGNEIYGKDLRSIFVPSSGYYFVEIDLSQAEARVDAVLAGNYEILSVFDGPIGIHKLTGSWVFDCDPSSIKKNTEEYHMAKTVRHAAERNMRADRMVMMTQKSKTECQDALDKIHGKQPELREVFHKDIRAAINGTLPGEPMRTLRAPNGRIRQFLGRIDDHLYNEAISQLPQAIVSDLLKFSFIPTMEKCSDFAYLINEAHDSGLAEVKIGEEMRYAEEFKKNVEVGIDFRSCTLKRDFELVIPCEVMVSKNSWYDLEEVKLG